MIRRAALAAAVLVATAAAVPALHAEPRAGAAPARPTPSGPLRAYRGPDGELIAMVEANDGVAMLVQFKNLDKELDGRTVLYRLEDLGNGSKNVYVDKPRGSKTYRSVLLTARDGDWEFYHPSKSGTHFAIYYSEKASGQWKVEDVLNAYKP